MYQSVGFGENIFECRRHFTEVPKCKLSVAVNWNIAVLQLKLVVFANETIFAG